MPLWNPCLAIEICPRPGDLSIPGTDTKTSLELDVVLGNDVLLSLRQHRIYHETNYHGYSNSDTCSCVYPGVLNACG